MAVTLDSLLNSSIRNLSGVHPRVKDYALELVRRSYQKGINVIITSGLRSMTGQAKLYGQGRSSYIYLGKQYANPSLPLVTHAEPGESIHNFGLAIDYALRTDNGAVVWDLGRDVNANGVKDWFEVAAIGKTLGFAWGGDWTKFKDYPHLDVQKGYSLATLRAGKRPTLPPVVVKDWLETGDRGAEVTALQLNFNKIGITVAVDGLFGPGMDATVRTFQEQNQLYVDGLFGPGSQTKLDQLVTAADARKKALEEAARAKAAAEAKAKAEAETASIREGEEVLVLNPRQRLELSAIFKDAREKGVFSSDEHEKRIVEGDMSVSEVIYLQSIISSAALNGGKRVGVAEES